MVMKNWVTVRREPYRDMVDVTKWAIKYCPTYITNSDGVKGGRTDHWNSGDLDPDTLDYFFGVNEQGQKDMMIFTLRWA